MEEIKQEKKKPLVEEIIYIGENDPYSNYMPVPKKCGITNPLGLSLFLQEIANGGEPPLYINKDKLPAQNLPTSGSTTTVRLESCDLTSVVKYGLRIGLGIASIFILWKLVKLIVKK